MPVYTRRWDEAGGREFGVKLWRTFRKPSRRILIYIQKRKFEFRVFHSSAALGLYIAIIQWILHINLHQPAQSWLHTGTNCVTLNKTSQCPHHTLGHPISVCGQGSDPSEAQSLLGDTADWGTWARRRDNSHFWYTPHNSSSVAATANNPDFQLSASCPTSSLSQTTQKWTLPIPSRKWHYWPPGVEVQCQSGQPDLSTTLCSFASSRALNSGGRAGR